MLYLSDDIYGFDLQEAMTHLSEQRLEQALRFRNELGQRLCVLAYRLLQRGLLEEYGITEPPVFSYGPHGKPTIVGHPEICFNMSHCREAALCLLGDREVGVDIESIRSYRPSLVCRTMNEREVELIERSAQPERTFIRLWTQKEAVLKLIGSGIRGDMRNVLDEGRWDIATEETPHYIYSVCRRHSDCF